MQNRCRPVRGRGEPGQSFAVRLDDQDRPPGAEDEEIAGQPGQPSDPAVEQFDVERGPGPVNFAGSVVQTQNEGAAPSTGDAAASRASSAAALVDAYCTPERPSTK